MKKNKFSDKQLNVILKSLRELLERGSWNTSAFLRVIGKKLQKVHDDFAARVHNAQQGFSHASAQDSMQHMPLETQQEIFIALYASDGANIQSWEKILMNLPRQAISRPVYAEATAIQHVFKERKSHLNEAYVVMYINRDAILPTPLDKTPKDRFGTDLLTLKNTALSLDNVIRFVHASGIYTYNKGRLTKVLDAKRKN